MCTSFAFTPRASARIVYVPSEFYPVAAPDWFWSDLILGDLAHSAIFDNSKIRRFVPSYSPRLTFHRAALGMAQWRAEHPEETKPNPQTDAFIDRLAAGYHEARSAFAALAPGAGGDRAEADRESETAVV